MISTMVLQAGRKDYLTGMDVKLWGLIHFLGYVSWYVKIFLLALKMNVIQARFVVHERSCFLPRCFVFA